jgi:hypothetical protein
MHQKIMHDPVTVTDSIHYCWVNFLLTSIATIDVPTIVAVQYNHRFVNTPETIAGANERAGFIEAPDIKARKNMSRPTIPQ